MKTESVYGSQKPFRFRYVFVLEDSLIKIGKQQNYDCSPTTPTPKYVYYYLSKPLLVVITDYSMS
jgi:hypothetical protein